SPPTSNPAIKISVYFHKLPSVTHEQFFAHWQTIHAGLALAMQAFRNNIIRYVQHHQTPQMKDQARSLGMNVLEYDACAQMWVRSWDDWVAFHNSEEYASALADDCRLFMQLPMTFMVGYENLIVGEAANEIGGRDGISLVQ
ncbi:hypothetical protein BO71DRAFT_323512, partial [Aspergillus ellipticus CBS 707.79]